MSTPVPPRPPVRPAALRRLSLGALALLTLAACDRSGATPEPTLAEGRRIVEEAGLAAGLPAFALDVANDALACGVAPLAARLGAAAPAGARLPNELRAAVLPGGSPFNGSNGTLQTSTTGFVLVDLGLFNGAGLTLTRDINDVGQIVGAKTARGVVAAWKWTAANGYEAIPAIAGGTQVWANGNNNANVVVGWSRGGSLTGTRAFRHVNGATDDLGAAFGGDSTVAHDVANDVGGTIVGHGRQPGAGHRVFTYRGGAFQNLGAPAGYANAYGLAISNDAQVIAGYAAQDSSVASRRAFVLRGGAFTLLPLPSGAVGAEAVGVNAAGQAVGFAIYQTSATSSFKRPVYWSATGAVTVIEALNGAANGDGEATDINDAGIVTGFSRAQNNDLHAFRWTAGSEPNTATDLGKASATSCSSFGYAINTAGDVGGSSTEGGNTTGVFWPVTRLTLGDRVWNDVNGDGQQDSNEPGIAGVQVTITGPNGFAATTTTDASGVYSFVNLVAGEYRVCVAAGSFAPGQPLAGLEATYDLDGIGTGGANCAEVELTANRVDVDFGYRAPAVYTIGDTVFKDLDRDGAYDAGEPGIPGVTLVLSGVTDPSFTRTLTTDAQGFYRFTGLPAGSYTVCVAESNGAAGQPLAGLTLTYAGGDTPLNPCVTVTVDATVGSTDEVDYGYAPSPPPAPRYAVGDLVWLDANDNDKLDAGERGIAGVIVEITGTETGGTVITPRRATTDANGLYKFDGLLAGEYTVCTVEENRRAGAVLDGFTRTFDLDGTDTPDCAEFTLGADRTDVDFGYQPPRFSIGDRVWYDADGDGKQDDNEPGFKNVIVRLLNAQGAVVATDTTNGSGLYTFTNLLAGTYKVQVVSGIPSGYAPTFDFDGIGTANVATVTVGPSTVDVDFGYDCVTAQRYVLGDRVWKDDDRDGVQDAHEPGVNGATVKLFSSTGAYLATDVTSGNGNYSFGNLPAGTYKVCVVGAPPGVTQFVRTFDRDGLQTPDCATVTLTANRTDVDFGYDCPDLQRFSLGDRVWKDLDGDGKQDSNEPGLGGVWVKAFNTQGAIVGWAQTNAHGQYTIGNLTAGTYKVCVVAGLPDGVAPTFDLDGTNTANCATVTLSANRTDVDFGYDCREGRIGDLAWIDANGNGRRDANEPGLAHVKLTLSGPVSRTLTTGSTGSYLFTALPAGTFQVAAQAPSGWVSTLTRAVSDTTVDSNANPSSVRLATASSSNLTVDFGFLPKALGGQGCTPGYWKQAHHFDSWKWYTPHQRLADVFGLTGLPSHYANLTLQQALSLNNSDGLGQLFRHGTAALLNGVYQSGVRANYNAAEVIWLVRYAHASKNASVIAYKTGLLSRANEQHCPLN